MGRQPIRRGVDGRATERSSARVPVVARFLCLHTTNIYCLYCPPFISLPALAYRALVLFPHTTSSPRSPSDTDSTRHTWPPLLPLSSTLAAATRPDERRRLVMTTPSSPPAVPRTVPQHQHQHQRPPPPILPKDITRHIPERHQDGDSSDEGEDEYDPSIPAPAPKRRGRKPGTMSRTARESQRKLNHSRIEKARRTKINETLSTLSDLVNEAEQQKPTYAGELRSAPEADAAKGKAKQGEKEFKLDVLVKAVSYVQELMARVKALEAQQCTHCASANSGKRKRDVAEEDVDVDGSVDADDVYVGDDEQDEDDDEPRPHPPSSCYSSVHPSPSPRLPPIASWLPHPYVDPSCIDAMSRSNAPPTSHLPSPPMSGTFRAAPPQNLQTLPNLTLPGPARPMPAPCSGTQAKPTPIQRVAASPSVSPTWTLEDETAASMLLQMSSSPRSVTSNSPTSGGMAALKLPQASPDASRKHSVSASQVYMQVQTPSSMLGM